MPSFVHLRTHSQYSLKDGVLNLEDPDPKNPVTTLAKLAANDEQTSVALTDLNNMFGVVPFYLDARKNGIKPLIGVDVWIDPDVTQGIDAAPVRMVLLCQDFAGYQKLMAWLSRAQLENHRSDVARLKQSWFKEGTEGLIALSGDGLDGELASLFTDKVDVGARAQADKVAGFYNEVFPGRYYLEVQRFAQKYETEQVAETVDLSRRLSLPLVATHPIQFAERSDFFAHEVRVCMSSDQKVEDMTRETRFTREQSFKTKKEMEELFADLPEALENTGHLAARCSASIPLGIPNLPHFPTPDGSSEKDYFEKATWAGHELRLTKLYPDEAERNRVRPDYDKRLQFEIDVINKMGFAGYFLIVSDFIQWSRNNDIPVGPGRGSGAGSLVAYALTITDLDPLRHGLLFERFLNPDRVSMPDFDIDFDIFGRGEVIDYVRKKYGESSVAQISTRGTAAARGVIRSVGKTLDFPLRLVDMVAKLIPKELEITLADALIKDDKFKDKYNGDASIRRLIDVAMKVEGVVMSIGKHAAGVVIAPNDIAEFSPLYLGKEGVVCQYDGPQVEKAGLVKFDFLGLANLSILKAATDFINARPEMKDKPFDLAELDLDDAPVYEEFAAGNTVGVFQFESDGMRGVLRRAKPSRFEDIVALNALFRPGPMDLIPSYCARKHGTEVVEYPDPRVESVLQETYGIMVYQEQVMQVAQILGGYSLGGADLLRRAMGKKDPVEMDKQRQIFADGAEKNGISRQKAGEIFDLIASFAGYGFNKSHAAAYSLIAYHTAYLKKHHPGEFYAASMNVAALRSKTDEIDKLIADARTRGVKIFPPDVNDGNAMFEPVGNSLRYGLSGLKGVNEGTINAIVKAREEQGRFESLFDFCRKVGRSVANKTTVEALVRAGAFDSLHPNRAAVFASVPDGLNYAAKLAKREASKEAILPADLFGEAPAPKRVKRKPTEIIEPMMADVPAWEPIVELEQERLAVGFYLSAHPFETYAQRLGGLVSAVPLASLEDIEPNPNETHLVAGVISAVKPITSGAGNKMAVVTIDDGQNRREAMVFPKSFEAHDRLLKVGAFLAMEAKVQFDRRDRTLPKGLLMEDAWDFESLEAQLANHVHINLKRSDLESLKQLAARHVPSAEENGMKVTVYLPEDEDTYLKADLQTVRLAATAACLDDIKHTFGEEKIKLGFNRQMTFRPKPPRFAKDGGGRGGQRRGPRPG